MHKIKEKLMEEIYELEDKLGKSTGKMSSSDLEMLHKLTDTVKNIDKIEMLEDGGGYSEESAWMADGRMYGASYDGGSSYARGRGRNAKRDSMGRYSRDGGSSYNDGMMRGGDSSYARDGRGGYSRDGASEHLINKAQEMLDMASSEEERRAIHQLIKKLEDD